ncbi:hypothetical protein [Streptomyces sp. NBC_00358]|uniref:hypothetical protein n=1 Tax=Streptomyces sp. NBC_00358 TaxID=2975725 RepID=UPI002E254293
MVADAVVPLAQEQVLRGHAGPVLVGHEGARVLLLLTNQIEGFLVDQDGVLIGDDLRLLVAEPRDVAVRVREGDGDDRVEVEQGDLADSSAGLDQQTDNADQLFVVEAVLVLGLSEQGAVLGDPADHGVAEDGIRRRRLGTGRLVAVAEQHGVLRTQALPAWFVQGLGSFLAFFEQEAVELLQPRHRRAALDLAEQRPFVRSARAALPVQPLPEPLDPPPELALVVDEVGSVAAHGVEVALEPREVHLAGEGGAPGVDATLQLARQPPLGGIAEPGRSQVAEVDQVAALGFVLTQRDARVQLGFPHIQLPPRTPVVDVNEEIQRAVSSCCGWRSGQRNDQVVSDATGTTRNTTRPSLLSDPHARPTSPGTPR